MVSKGVQIWLDEIRTKSYDQGLTKTMLTFTTSIPNQLNLSLRKKVAIHCFHQRMQCPLDFRLNLRFLQFRLESIPRHSLNVSDWKIPDKQIVPANPIEVGIYDFHNFQAIKHSNLSESSHLISLHHITSVNKSESTNIWEHVLVDKYSIEFQLFQNCNIPTSFREL
jgi:hypothetical protein